MHILCGRGNLSAVQHILSVFDRGEFVKMDHAFMIQLLNQKTTSGAGCVDAALKAKIELAHLLQRFGAREQRPPPVKKVKGKGAGKGGGNNWTWKSGSDAAAASGHGEGDGPVWNQNTGASSSSSWNQNTSDWNQWSEWGDRTWRSKSRAVSPYPGQYDHRGTAPEDKGMGVYAHDRKMRRYEEKADGDAPSSEDSERSDS